MRDISQIKKRLREIAILGTSDDFSERLKALRENSRLVRDVLPTVTFGASGRIKCWPFPMPENTGYELIYVVLDGQDSFPEDPGFRCQLIGITSDITVIHGELLITVGDISTRLQSGDSLRVDAGDPYRVVYSHDAVVIFKQSPRIAVQELRLIEWNS